ncbi:TraC family protein, partial [Escherichia coli]|uniref:TraC family protein n=1 Tax=Escherichia coli TaxID=562 RepID=UPI003F4FE226
MFQQYQMIYLSIDTTMGFMLEAIPINGANESIVEALDHMLRTKLPRGIPLCIHLMS